MSLLTVGSLMAFKQSPAEAKRRERRLRNRPTEAEEADATADYLAGLSEFDNQRLLIRFYRLRARWHRARSKETRAIVSRLELKNREARKEARRHG